MPSVATARTPALTATPSTHYSKMLAASSPISILKPAKPTGTKRTMEEAELSLSPSSSFSDAGAEDVHVKKRPRVTFAEKAESQAPPIAVTQTTTTMAPMKSLPVVREEVRKAIHRHVMMGENEAYDEIKEIFTADPKKADDPAYSYELPTHADLRNHLMGLLSHISSLDRNCSSLVTAILNSEWLGRDDSYVKLFTRFLGNLAAAQGGYLSLVLKMLVTKLAGIPRGTGRLPGYSPVSTPEIFNRVHKALRHVMRLIPAGSGALSPLLSSQFPFDTDSAKSYICYTQNLIRIVSYTPELQSDILAVITEKLVKVDVQIQVDLEDFEDELGEDLLQDVSPEEDVDDEADDDSIVSDESDDDSNRVTEIKGNIQKVDGMIDILFEYYTPPFMTGSLDDKENALDLLLSHFQTIILPTYRSRHSQFLLFHFSQCSPVLVDRFASACVQIIFNKLQPSLTRQSAAAYLASFVARGAHISGEVVRDVFDILLTHLNNLRDSFEDGCRGPDLRRYGPFYSTAQAIIYIFCFRWRDLTTAAIDGDSPEQVEELEPSQVGFPPNIKEILHKSIYSRLNPLKICSPGIVTEFARIAHHFQLLYVYPLLETNKRLRVSAFRSIASLTNANFGSVERDVRAGDHLGYQLDAYFPFDPYQLPRSRRWLEGDYVEWRGIPGLDDDDDSDSEADDDGEDDEEIATATDEE
ncbi:RNA polymerase I specific transcription initiation factor RRN3 [Penicillium cosmopolitanum]|uniref:RNA polymerase I specific transcription initiation factor RRN3 n=1 Tax=Penicillium cosmopolitanum TaxID=1131564 RepID=A0A9W9VMM6_9EURO|nr:RNA polymerase I specific transcription initiation factor RRN3 [Penicillium cosmopolitanum]KAJ5385915.1 RNA polymerase I specific transcription initiation factor RRN3 [Penicillium cosmopolitanum]